jgi:hypothetical protein
LRFGPDGYLYIGTGDGGSSGDPGNRSQNNLELLGKMLRIDVNDVLPYSVPQSNPFVGNPLYRPEIWATGLRNPWRYAFDRLTGDLWIADVGQGQREEIDFQPASSGGGENYGWRCYEGNNPYNTVGCQAPTAYKFPVYEYPHSGPNSGCSVTGGYVYRGAGHASLFGRYFFGDYCTAIIGSVRIDSIGNFIHTPHGAFAPLAISTFGEDKYGEIYLAGLTNGIIYKLRDTSCTPTAFISFNDTLRVCGDSTRLSTPEGKGFMYQWYLNGSVIANANLNYFSAIQNGNYHVVVWNPQFCQNTSKPLHVVINQNPPVTLAGVDTFYCLNASPVIMMATPVGGVFTGPGITGNVFNPSAAGIGYHTLVYAYTDSNGCSAKTSFITRVDGCTGLTETGKKVTIRIYPNPGNNEFKVLFESQKTETIMFSVINKLGKLVYSSEQKANQGINTYSINLQGQAHSIYFLKVVSSSGSEIIRIVQL